MHWAMAAAPDLLHPGKVIRLREGKGRGHCYCTYLAYLTRSNILAAYKGVGFGFWIYLLVLTFRLITPRQYGWLASEKQFGGYTSLGVRIANKWTGGEGWIVTTGSSCPIILLSEEITLPLSSSLSRSLIPVSLPSFFPPSLPSSLTS